MNVSGLLAVCVAVLIGFFPMWASHSEDEETAQKSVSATRIDESHPLKPLNSLVGDWRGVGQLKRGSRTGAWAETVSCAWQFDKGIPAVALTAKESHQFDSLKITWDAESKQIVLQQTLKDMRRMYRGTAPAAWSDRVELTSEPDENGITYRCTIQQLSEIRATLLFEQQASSTGSYRRIAGIGYTRAGEKLAESGGNARKCIVTGGLGTIPVTYMGKTYYVCCQGCVQAFNDAPEAIIADYQESLKKKPAK